jgi:hypothetical protein
MKDGRKETTACQEAMETSQKKMDQNPEMVQSVVEHQEVPKEEATVRSTLSIEEATQWPESGRRTPPEAEGKDSRKMWID